MSEVETRQQAYRQKADLGQFDIIYKFGDGLIDDSLIEISQESIVIPTFKYAIELPKTNPFEDMV